MTSPRSQKSRGGPNRASLESEETLLTLTNIDKVYSNLTVALKDVSLTIKKGEFLSLLGPSGCGKSTLLRIIAGLGEISGGELVWNQAKTTSGHPEIGFVFQEPTLMPWATVYKNIELPLKLRGLSKADAKDKIEMAIEQVGLTGFGDAYPRELSGGMKMRVSVARALVAEPNILLMDEPFAALDEITRFRLNDDLLRLWSEQSLTIVFVTHSVFESVYLSSRVVIMGASPGSIYANVEIADPSPRAADYRTSTSYNNYCKKVSHLLSQTH